MADMGGNVTANEDAPEVLLSASEAELKLFPFTEAQISSIARSFDYVREKDVNATKAISSAVARLGPDNAYYLYAVLESGEVCDHPLEFSMCGYPRSTAAFNNSPDGNAVLDDYKAEPTRPQGLYLVESNFGKDQYTKRCVMEETVWTVNVWQNMFNKLKGAEWSMSIKPVDSSSHRFAVDVFQATDARFLKLADTLQPQKSFQANRFPPDHTMFMMFTRPVAIPQANDLDEGRESEYKNSFRLQPRLEMVDLKYNSVPEVNVVDQRNKVEHQMSWHHIHELNSRILTQAFIIRSRGRDKKAKDMISWEYRLLNVTVMGQKSVSLTATQASPPKTVKRKATFLDLEDSPSPQKR